MVIKCWITCSDSFSFFWTLHYFHGLLRGGLLAAPIFVIISNLNFLPLTRCWLFLSEANINSVSQPWLWPLEERVGQPVDMSGVQFKLQSKDWLRSYSRKTNLPIFGGHLTSIKGQIAAITRDRGKAANDLSKLTFTSEAYFPPELKPSWKLF